MRKWATVVFALAGTVALVYAVGGDPCDLPDISPILVVAAMLSGGVVAFSLVEERTRHVWIPIAAANSGRDGGRGGSLGCCCGALGGELLGMTHRSARRDRTRRLDYV